MLAFAIQEYIIYHILHIYLISVSRIQKWKLDTILSISKPTFCQKKSLNLSIYFEWCFCKEWGSIQWLTQGNDLPFFDMTEHKAWCLELALKSQIKYWYNMYQKWCLLPQSIRFYLSFNCLNSRFKQPSLWWADNCRWTLWFIMWWCWVWQVWWDFLFRWSLVQSWGSCQISWTGWQTSQRKGQWSSANSRQNFSGMYFQKSSKCQKLLEY